MDKKDHILIAVVLAVAIGLVGYTKYKNKILDEAALPPDPYFENLPPDTPTPPEKTYTFDEALEGIKEEEIKTNLYYLASDELEGRMSGKSGNIKAAEFIKEKYESYGLPTEYDKFEIDRVNPGPKREEGDDFTQNIYAWIDGNDPAVKDEIVVIGAHMDHIGYGPSMSRAPNRREVHNGADDNASGTVALLEIAKAFSRLRGEVKRTVVFQSYSAEEMGLIGSRHYCDHPTFPKDSPSIRKHVMMVNMDMIGRLNGGFFAVGWGAGESSVDISRIIDELNNKYPFARKITSRGSGGSDHACFYNKHVPVAFLHTGLHPHYHTPDDDADKINFQGMEQISKYAFELAWKVCQGETAPKFNLASFKEMEYTHDHGNSEFPIYHKYHRHE